MKYLYTDTREEISLSDEGYALCQNYHNLASFSC